MKKILSLLFIGLIFTSVVFAQKKRSRSPIGYINSIQLVGSTGSSTYYGDLCDNADCMRFRPNIGIGVQYRYNQTILFRSELHFVQLYSTDEGGKNYVRNLHFRNNIFEYTFTTIYDLIPYQRNFAARSPFTPYLFGGVGLFYHSPQAKHDDYGWVNLRELQTENIEYARFSFSIPYGIGVRYKVNDKLNISTEAGYRWTFTDYIDDVSTKFVDPNADLSQKEKRDAFIDRTHELDGELKPVFAQSEDFRWRNHWEDVNSESSNIRGNPKKKDGYFLFNFKFEYRLKYTTQGVSIVRKSKFR